MSNELKEKVEILEDFVNNTRSVEWLYSLLDFFILEFRYRKMESEDVVQELSKMKGDLNIVLPKEYALQNEYDQIMSRGEYDDFDFLQELVNESRRVYNVPEGKEVEMVEGSPEFETALKNTRLKRDVHLKEKNMDYNLAFEKIYKLAEIRVELYSQLPSFGRLIEKVYSLSQQEYFLSCTKGSESFQQSLEEEISGLAEYVNDFPKIVSKLVSKFPECKLVDAKSLTD